MSNGHNIKDVKYEYSISQVYLFFEKIRKMDLDKEKMNAIILANCLMYSQPASDASSARKKNRAFQQFMDSLNWNKLVTKYKERTKPKTAENVLKSLFGGVGLVPLRNKSKK